MANPTCIPMPRIIYGTAWKKERTTDLVVRAIRAGFRGIDTACQPKHYREDLVGEALGSLLSTHNIRRDSLFLQTKFTPIGGQDLNNPIPYDAHAPLADQVRQSFAQSLRNLRTDYLDSLLLHSPMAKHENTMEVWRVFEEFYQLGKVRQIGISNLYNFQKLNQLWKDARVKPTVIQNRFYLDTDYDKDIRTFCRNNGIVYQSFWTLTANPHLLSSNQIRSIAAREGKTPEQVFFRFVIQLGITPLTGTTNDIHMREDLDVLDWSLADDDMRKIGGLLGESQ